MKKRYCISVSECIAGPMVVPLMWTVALLFWFLFMLLMEGTKDMASFWAMRRSGWRLWFYLSGPISLVASAFLSGALILFPVNYIELGEETFRIHKAFKKDRIILYENIDYVRLDYHAQRLWPWVLICPTQLGDLTNVEVHINRPYSRLWLSSTKRAFFAISSKLKSVSAGKRELIEGRGFVADAEWTATNGCPGGFK
ncbi:MAG: hypothetical protein E7182_05060 [Erysipelotrichaceae bacterium]|nr:hypothetical protein [Erysipelotrichaceae bacterium]